jgi:hypothetical protein
MGHLAALRTAQVPHKARGVPVATLESVRKRADAAQQTQIGRIAAFIPSEAVSFYIAGLAVVASLPDTDRAIALQIVIGVAVAVNFVLTFVAFRETLGGKRRSVLLRGKFWLAVLVATVALGVYAVALPGNPILGDAYRWSPLILLIGVVGIPLAATLFGIMPVPKVPERDPDADD